MKALRIWQFHEFGGGDVLHHNNAMLANTLSIVVSSSLMASTTLPFLDFDHETPLCIVGDAIGYVILWLWNLTSFSM
jgi:hypothetical protein